MLSALWTISELFQTCLPMRSKRVCRRVVQFVQYSECACCVTSGLWHLGASVALTFPWLINPQRFSTVQMPVVQGASPFFPLKPDICSNMFHDHYLPNLQESSFIAYLEPRCFGRWRWRSVKFFKLVMLNRPKNRPKNIIIIIIIIFVIVIIYYENY